MPPIALPADYTQRPLSLDDAGAVYAVMAAQELHDLGSVEIEEADIVGDWQRPSYDVTSCSIGVWSDGTLVAYAELTDVDRYDAAVHPDHRGRGIGTAIAGWVCDLARERGAAIVGMPVPAGSPGDHLLESLGYHVRWTSWELELPPGSEVETRALPDGYAVREALEADRPSAYEVQETAFLEWSDRARESYDDWAARTVLRPGFEPWNLRVITDPAGAVVAMAFVIASSDATSYVDRLATHPDHRGRGLAQALLVDSFAIARDRGATGSSLSTDSRTGALGLYERVGMVVTSTWVHRAANV